MTAYDIIIKPVVTERSMENMESKRYTFKVDTRANKSEIKKAVETIFGVKVKQVNTMNITGKKKRSRTRSPVPQLEEGRHQDPRLGR